MTLEQIFKEVKYAIDEADNNFNADNISLARFMVDNRRQIARCAQSAVRWLAHKAPPEMLAGSDEDMSAGVPDIMQTNPSDCVLSNRSSVSLPADFIRLARVRLDGWNRSIQKPIFENSEEYLMVNDVTATATGENPVAALILDNPRKLELWPKGDNLSITIIREPKMIINRLKTVTPDTDSVIVPIPPAIHEPLVYMTAYLLLAGYRDSGAAAMFEITKSYIQQS